MPADESKPKHAPGGSNVPNRTPEDPTVRARRAAIHRRDGGDAFLPDPTRTGLPVNATDAEFFGEEFVASATTGEPQHMDAADEVLDSEDGGPFLELDASEEASDIDAMETTGQTGQDATVPRQQNVQRNVRRSLPR
jgi:hypothetical protein